MKLTTILEIEARLTASMINDPETGPDEISDVSLESAFMFHREWTRSELKAEFGNLAEWIEEHVDVEEFEYEE